MNLHCCTYYVTQKQDFLPFIGSELSAKGFSKPFSLQVDCEKISECTTEHTLVPAEDVTAVISCWTNCMTLSSKYLFSSSQHDKEHTLETVVSANLYSLNGTATLYFMRVCITPG